MKRIWKFVLFGVLAAVVVVAADMWLTWRSFTDLDKAVWKEASGESLEVSDIVAQHLPDDFKGAATALRRYGFVEGDRYVGTNYRRRPVPANDLISLESRRIMHFNHILDMHDAELAKYFQRKIPRLHFGHTKLSVYLLITKDGALKVYATTHFPVSTFYI